MDILRIIEKFNITNRGTVYVVRQVKGVTFCIGAVFCDLRGSRFSVKGIEMFRRPRPAIPYDEFPIGILLNPLSGKEVFGDILVSEPFKINFLYCSHPLYPEQVDECFKEEYQAAGLKHDCALFSYDDFEAGTLSLYGKNIDGITIYRGWMMKPELYRKFYSALESREILLINTPDEYDRYHMLPGWYESFSEETPKSFWTSGNDIEDVLRLAKKADGTAYIVKDYVKSRKHEWYDACFIRDISDISSVRRIVGNFINRQGEDLVGGVVLRKYESLKRTGFHEQSGMPLSEEYRIFVYAGEILAIDAYWDKNSAGRLSEEEYRWIDSIAKRVQSNFVTVDIARKEDGSLIIVEFGDGQVSGLQQTNAENFYEAFSKL